MMRMSVPLSNRWVAKLCRSVWTVTRLLRPEAAHARTASRVQHGRTDRMLAVAAREQPMSGSRQPPIRPQDAQQLRARA